MDQIKVLLVDDHNVVRQGLKLFLATQPDINVVGEADNGAAAIAAVAQYQPDVVLMDLLMPQMDGIGATQQIKSKYPDVEIIALTSFVEDAQVAARLMQAIGPKEQPPVAEPLTEREIEVLKALTRGESNKQIADTLVVSEKTVKAHVSNILGKLGLQSRTQAVLYALRHGMVSLDDIPL